MMKRVLLLMMVLIFAVAASAEEMRILFEDYAPLIAGEDTQAWEADGSEDIQVLAVDENVSLNVCLENGEIIAVTVEAMLDAGVYDYACMAFEPMNVLDGDTLAALETLEEGETLSCGGWLAGRLSGETREGIYLCVEAFEGFVWQPMHGGKKCHSNLNCSGMDIPRMVSETAAEDAGYDRCKRCKWSEDES